ncbi:hypothetical protein G3O08_20795, partial [Cryomorpha ignava]
NIVSEPFDCPELEANFGSACDDGDASTSLDTVNEDCVCAGIPIPDNDEACNATNLFCNETLTGVSFLGATPSYEDDCFQPGNGDIWFSFTTQIGEAYSIDISGNGPSSTALTSSLFAGDDCTSLDTLLTCNTFAIGYIFGEADTIQTYYVRVRAYSNAQSVDITLQCGTPPANGDCSTAEEVSCFETYTGSTLAAPDLGTDLTFCGVSSFQEPDADNGGNWYTYTPDQDITAT